MTNPSQPSQTYPTAPGVPDPNEYHENQRVAAVVALWIGRFAYAYLAVVVTLLVLAFLLLLFGANATGFVDWVYRSTDRAMRPFQGAFNTIDISGDSDVRSVFDPSLLLAALVYSLIAMAIHTLVNWLSAKVASIESEQQDLSRQATMVTASRDSGLSAATGNYNQPPVAQGPAPTSSPAPDGGQP